MFTGSDSLQDFTTIHFPMEKRARWLEGHKFP